MLPDLKEWEANPPKGAPNLIVVSDGTVEDNRSRACAPRWYWTKATASQTPSGRRARRQQCSLMQRAASPRRWPSELRGSGSWLELAGQEPVDKQREDRPGPRHCLSRGVQGREPREDARTSGRTAPPPSGLPDRLTRATGYHLVTNRAKNQEVSDRTSEAYDCDALT